MTANHSERDRSANFIALLIDDVMAARRRLSASDTQGGRRDIVRTTLAAMEGLAWELRRHVASILATYEALSPVADLALRETSYTVTQQGQIVEQVRGLPLLTAIRLAIAQAKIVSPEMEIDFSGNGWSELHQAIVVRNRITHPKSLDQIMVEDSDLDVVGSSLSWLTATSHYVMASTNLALVSYADEARILLDRLRAGDANAIADYKLALEHG